MSEPQNGYGGFKKATKHESKLRLALIGPSGSGKTYSGLAIALSLGSKVALVDTERGSASKYADEFPGCEFDVLELQSHHPQAYIDAIKLAERAGYDVLVLDSLSHAWNGKEGALELVDKAQKKSQSGNSFMAWRDVTPLHNALVDAILNARLHVIATMRAKTEYVMDEDSRGKKVPRKVGMAPIQRDGIEYEFDVVGDINLDHELIISKTRCPLLSGAVIAKPGDNLASVLKGWLQGAPDTRKNNDPVTITADDAAAIDDLGKLVYGDDWPAKSEELASAITRGFTGDYTKLTPEEGERMLAGLRKKYAEQTATAGEATHA